MLSLALSKLEGVNGDDNNTGFELIKKEHSEGVRSDILKAFIVNKLDQSLILNSSSSLFNALNVLNIDYKTDYGEVYINCDPFDYKSELPDEFL